MSLLISQITFPTTVAAGRDAVTNLRIARVNIAKNRTAPIVRMADGDGAYWRYLVEVLVADQSSALLAEGAAQLVVSPSRIAGLVVKGQLTRAKTKQKVKLDQDAGQMACFSIGCGELGVAGVPTNRRGKPSAIHLGTDISRGDGFAIKIRDAIGFLNNDGKTGPVDMERIVSRLDEIGLTISRGASLY